MSEGEGQVYQRLKRLRDAKDARQYMQALIEAVDKNRITEKKARCIGYLIKIFLDTYELADIQKELEEIREIIDKQGRWTA